jgi:hypothetical protein
MSPVKFEPENQKSKEAPYFEDVSGDVGFRGMGTHKSIERLQGEVTNAISNLGGFIVSVQRGKFIDERARSRYGFVFVFTIPGPGGGHQVMAEIKVAAFPLRKWSAAKEEQAKKMALYVLRDWLESLFNFQKLTPAPVATLIPFMLDRNGETLSDAWISGKITPGLLLTKGDPIPDSGMEDVIDAEASQA